MDLDRKILNLLREKRGQYLSGEELARILGVSRTAVWKRVRRLKERCGYNIESRFSCGYRLHETLLPLDSRSFSLFLDTCSIGRPLKVYPEVASTNDIAYQMALDGATEGATVIADSQSKGKGRLGRRWESPPGVNLYTSIVLRPSILPLRAPQITFVSAIAVAETIKKTCPCLNPLIKWPNDILINYKKVSGILTEMNSEMDRVNFIISGIGVNINMTSEMFPQELRQIATSLKDETGITIDRVSFTRCLFEEFERYYRRYLDEGFTPILKRWRSLSCLDDSQVEVVQSGKRTRGIVEGIDDEGALLLRDGTGRLSRIVSGDVVII